MSAVLSRPTPITAAAAIRIGRALESWGRKHARRRDDHRIDRVRLCIEARAALDERDRLIWTTTFAPYV
jgi:hypothetical protein